MLHSVGFRPNTLKPTQGQKLISQQPRFQASGASDEYEMREASHGALVFTLAEMGMNNNKAIRELLLQGAESIYTIEIGIPLYQFAEGLKQRASRFPNSPLDNFETAFDTAVQNGFTQDELCQVLRISVKYMSENDPDPELKTKAAQVYRLMTQYA